MTAHPGPLDRAQVVRSIQRLATTSLRFSERSGASRGLHRSDLHALELMVAARDDGRGPMTPTELSHELGLSPSATTALVDRLERVGHVRRVNDEVDRRRVGVEMTETAGAEARALFGPLALAMMAMMEGFDDDELRVVERFLAEASDTVEAMSRQVGSAADGQ